MSSLLPLLLVALAVPAHAGAVYKCSSDKGGVTYQDTACGPGRDLGNVDVEPPRINGAPAAKGAPPKAVRSETAPARSGDPAQRRLLQTGMSEAEVVQKVGRPDMEGKPDAK